MLLRATAVPFATLALAALAFAARTDALVYRAAPAPTRSGGSLGAYINQVRAQSSKKLAAASAEDLVTEAAAVRDSLGCGTS